MDAATTIDPDLAARRDHGVAWMNRGHEQLRQGNATGNVAALLAYEQAIALLRTLPVHENPAWANSLGAAWMNRGQLLHRTHGTVRAAEALASFEAAASALQPALAGQNPWTRRNLAGTRLNRANLLLDLDRADEAAAAAREALAIARPHERTELVDADLALKARRALGDALGQLLVAPGANQDALADEASDVVDDALAMIRHWRSRDDGAFQSLAARFFRYGAQLYRFHQPHFLAEFIEENLGLDAVVFRSVALETVDATLADAPRTRPYLIIGDPATERHLRTRRELENLRARLTA